MTSNLQLTLMVLDETAIKSVLSSQNSIDSLNRLTTIINITFIPLLIILIYACYLYLSLKNRKLDNINISE